jgi:hypothetical protein
VSIAERQACAAGRNGGATDRGVTGTSIKLGATVVSSGIGASFLGPVRIGINAVTDKINRTGGICGRRLDVTLVDDGWDAQRGYGYIRNLIEGDKVFALAVNPSSEGLRIASNAGYFAKTQTPVVGTDGMLNSQYADPWVWPVASSTVSTMHIMATDAYNRLRARHFSIVFDSQYHFGVEGAFAFNCDVKRLTGQSIPGYFEPGSSSSCNGRFCAITAGRASYATENKTFNDACSRVPKSTATSSRSCSSQTRRSPSCAQASPGLSAPAWVSRRHSSRGRSLPRVVSRAAGLSRGPVTTRRSSRWRVCLQSAAT